MKKQTKLMAVLSAAALMTAVTPNLVNFAGSTAYAKTTGWVQEDGTWYFYEEEDYFVTDSWKKKGNDWHYLNEDGQMTTNTKVDEFYVDADGKMVTNQWISIQNEEDFDSPESPENYWYYFGKDGRAISSKWQSIAGNWHYFNEEGQMLTGKTEIDGATYYLGGQDDGIMSTGWVQLEDSSENPDANHSWYFFDNNGKMIENQVDKKINGNYYTFVNGRMQTEWYKLPEASTSSASVDENASIEGYQYYEKADGKRASGWYQITGAEGVSEEDEIHSFYFKNGKPYFAKKGMELFSIDSKKYAFNTKGEMQTGLNVVNLDNDAIANFYFGTDGVMKTGKQTIYDEDLGENQTWFFYTDGSRKGQGFHGVRDNSVYIYGLRKDADADLRFAPVDFEGTQYLVNTSGAIQKSSSSSKSSVKPELGNGFKDVKDSNGKTWVVNTNGIIQ